MRGTTENVISQKRGFLGNVLGPSMKVALLLMKNVLTLLVQSVLIPLRLTVEGGNWLGMTKSLEESCLLIKGVSKIWKGNNRTKYRFLNMLLGTLGASLLGNLLAGKQVIQAGERAIRDHPVINFEIQKY